MKRRSVYIFIASSLVMLIPAPGRFVYGLTLVFELLFSVLFGTLTYSLMNQLKMEKIRSVAILLVEVSFTILFRQIMVMLYPEVILVLGFIIYLLPISYFVIGYLFANPDWNLKQRLRFNMIHVLTFSVYSLLFFLFRDLAGYGTFTFFGKNHQIFEKVIVAPEKFRVLSFAASIPGAFMLSAIILLCFIIIRKKLEIIRRTEVTE